ncbi:phage tail tube protein [Moraxella canis]|uniref:phage tail tube protein n=1 Tax=Moraxella canis TaxID=90239 RepID=UPI0006675EA4|nr:phage tail tube protein [Moraxella canis]
MAKNVANLVDSFYQLFVSTDGEDFKKVEHLTKCSVPSDEKVLDDVTATDDKRTIKAVVDFKEESEIEFEFVVDPEDAAQKLVQKAFDDGSELHFQLKFVKASSESRKFTGLISKLSVDNEDTKRKLRKTATIAITGDVSKITD